MNSELTGEGDVDDVVQKNIAIFGYKQWLLSTDMKTKVVQPVPRINLSYLKFQIFKNFQIFSGSQLLSDFQTFFIPDILRDLKVPKISPWPRFP